MSLLKRISDVFVPVLTLVAVLCLATLAVLISYDMVMHYVFNNAPDFVEPIALLMVMAIAVFGVAFKVREGGHIGLDSFVERLPAGGKHITHMPQKLYLIAFTVVVSVDCFDMVETTLGDHIPTLGLPEAVCYWVLIVASAVIALFALERPIGLSAQDVHQVTMDLAIFSANFLAFLILGALVSFTLSLSRVLTYLRGGLSVATAMQSVIFGTSAFSFLAMPFLVPSGELILHGGIINRILRFAQTLVGHFHGGLGMTNMAACTLFGGVSGSPTADTSAMGNAVAPLMKCESYSAAHIVSVIAYAPLAGALMPISANMIVYALAAQGIAGSLDGQQMSGTSIGDPLLSGLLPVLRVMSFVLIVTY